MPPGPPNRPILEWAGRGQGQVASDLLRRRLKLPHWPWPAESFPAGSALVGGAVRDGLLDRLGPRPDLDLVVPTDAIALCRQLSHHHGGSVVILDAERSIARLVHRGWTLDLARQAGDDLPSDLWRRDFRINALALPLHAEAVLVDPTGGLDDLVAGELVAVRERNLLEDPLRLLRGVRLAAELGFRLETRTGAWIRQHHRRIAEVAPERVLQELEKLARAHGGGDGLAEALTAGLLEPWCTTAPETLWLDPAAVVAGLSPAHARRLGLSAAETARGLPLARLACVLDATALERLRSSRQWQQRCARLRHWLGRLLGDEASVIASGQALQALAEPDRLRLHQQLEQDLPALLLFFPTGLGAEWLERWRDPRDPLFHPRPPIDGVALQQALGVRPSPRLGTLLAHLTQEAAFGRIAGRDGALREARRWLDRTPA